jgi:N-acetylmuramoyl-L-alanine amidase
MILILSALLLTLLFTAHGNVLTVNAARANNSKSVIVIDAGHGGKDGGVRGVNTGTQEADLNLEYAVTLKRIMEEKGYAVVMTRTAREMSYSSFKVTDKQKEMRRRIEIIENSGAAAVISIHMNGYTVRSVRGAQVFYNNKSPDSKELARLIQGTLNTNVNAVHAKRECLFHPGDYYILNNTKIPAVITECGYLSNAEDERLLLDKDYREAVCKSIAEGVGAFLALSGKSE